MSRAQENIPDIPASNKTENEFNLPPVFTLDNKVEPEFSNEDTIIDNTHQNELLQIAAE
jgi:hypothetical protein